MTIRKRILLCVMTFLLSFMMLTRKPYEPKAEVLTLTASTVYLFASVLSMMGLVIVNQDLIVDISAILLDELKTIPGALEEIISPKDPEIPEEPEDPEDPKEPQKQIALHLLPEVKEKIKEVVNDLPEETVIKSDPTAIDYKYSMSYDEIITQKFTKGTQYTYMTLQTEQWGLWIQLFNENGEPLMFDNNSTKLFLKPSSFGKRSFQPGDILQITTEPNGTTTTFINGTQGTRNDISQYETQFWNETSTFGYKIQGSEDWDREVKISNKPQKVLPYTGEIKTNFDENKIDSTVPENSVIKVPTSTELPPISENEPFTPDPDKIEIETPGTSTPDNPEEETPPVDNPSDTPGSNPSEEYKTFWEVILAPILELLRLIWQVLVSIFNFLVETIKFCLDSIVNVLYATFDLVMDIYMWLVDTLVKLFSLDELMAELSQLADSFLDGLTQTLNDLFIPTKDISTMFEFPDDLKELPTIEMDRLFNINTKPIVYTFTFNMGNVVKEITLDFSKIDVLEDNRTLIQNLFSYCLLLGALYRIVNELKPIRTMD